MREMRKCMILSSEGRREFDARCDEGNSAYPYASDRVDIRSPKAHGKFSGLAGKRVVSVELPDVNDVYVLMVFDDGTAAEFWHEQDCCEVTWLDTETGDDPRELVGCTIVSAHVGKVETSPDTDEDAYFYHIRCADRDVTLVWRGNGEGYYSTSISYVIGPLAPQDEE